LLDPLGLVGRGDATLDEGQVHRSVRVHRPGLGEVHDVDQLRELQQGLASVDEGQLAAVAGTELVHRDARPGIRPIVQPIQGVGLVAILACHRRASSQKPVTPSQGRSSG
jgi:hypothetical protein